MKQMYLKLSAAATAICFGWLRWQGASLFTAKSKGGIVDLEMADTPEKLQHLMGIWNKPVAVNNMLTFEQISWGPLSAAALLVTAPVLILTLLAQKQIVAGLTAGGVKGA